MKIIQPSDGIIRPNQTEHSLFLVGPTPRVSSVPTWRLDALGILGEIGYKGWVYVPEPFAQQGYEFQIRWETTALTYVEVIAAWVPRDMATMPALTTNIEFGEWFKNDKFVYGRPPTAPNCGYLDERYKYRGYTITGVSEETTSKFGNKPHTSLRSLLVAATAGECERNA